MISKKRVSSADLERVMKLLDHARLRDRGVPYGKVQLWRLEKAGKFPKRVALSPSRIAWIESEVDAWIKKRVAARDNQKEVA